MIPARDWPCGRGRARRHRPAGSRSLVAYARVTGPRLAENLTADLGEAIETILSCMPGMLRGAEPTTQGEHCDHIK